MNNCPICDADILNVAKLKIREYKLTKCPVCGLIFSNPLPDEFELNEYYQGFTFEKPSSKDKLKQVLNAQKEIKKHFGTFNVEDNKLLLDYGGGVGIFWKAAKNLGYDAYYYDIDLEAIEYAINNLELEKEKIFNPNNPSNLKFDCIMCDNVIEHVPYPQKLLEFLYELLKPNGKLIIKTPLASNTEILFTPVIFYMYFKNAIKQNSLLNTFKFLFIHPYYHCDPPRHIYSFSKKSLEILAKNSLSNQKISFSKYYNPIFKFAVFKIIQKKYTGNKRLLMLFLFLPIIIIDIIISLLRFVLLKLHVLSFSGLIFKVQKCS